MSHSAPVDAIDAGPPTPFERHATAAATTAGLGAAWVVGRGLLPFDLACPFLAATGIPCPFCGMTRLSDHLLRLDVVGAVTGDPAGVVFLAVLGVLAAVGAARRLGWAPTLWPSSTPVVAVLVTTLALHWITTLGGGGFVSS